MWSQRRRGAFKYKETFADNLFVTRRDLLKNGEDYEFAVKTTSYSEEHELL